MNKQRPILKNLVNKNTTAVEEFQNVSIRPIIKMQHKILVLVFRDYILKIKVDFTSLSEEKMKVKIKAILDKDINYKKFIVGLIVGHFKEEEYLVYREKTNEFNRRILQIVTQRLQDSLLEI